LVKEEIEKRINSEEYWDKRFSEDWEKKEGREQSVFFGRLAIKNFPDWFVNRVKSKNFTICDWGCAFGDGTKLLTDAFPQSKITGVDFAKNAIDIAKKEYPEIRFLQEDFLSKKANSEKYDVLFSSNTLEHFEAPLEILKKIVKYSSRYVVLLIPFREEDLIKEHFSSFDFETTPLFLKGWTLIHSGVINTKKMTPNYWYGEQLLLIYSKEKEIAEINISLGDIVIHSLTNTSLNGGKYVSNPKSKNSVLSVNDGYLKDEIERKKKKIDLLQRQQIELQKEINSSLLENASLKRQYEDLYQEFYSIVNSRRWRYINKYASLFNRFFPDGSFRKKIIHSVIKTVKAFVRFLKKIIKIIINIILSPYHYFLIKKSNLFDEKYYLETLNKKFLLLPILHYLLLGWKNHPSSSRYFDGQYYQLLTSEFFENPLIRNIKKKDFIFDIVEPFKNFYDKYDPEKETLAFQLESFDKGGLEEVVLSLCTSKMIGENYNIVVFVVGRDLGYLSEIASKKCVPIFILGQKEEVLQYLIKKLDVKICNLHYSVFGLPVYRQNSVKTVYTIHNNYIWGDKSFIYDRKEKYKFVDLFIAVSKQVGQYFAKKFDVSFDRINVVPNGVEYDLLKNFKIMKRESFGLKKKDFVFVNVSSFIENKFHIVMILAMKKLVLKFPEIKLLFVGNILDKNYFDRINKLIRKYELEKNILIINFLPKKKLLGVLNFSDCFILPSLTEGFSISVIEAMYYKLPLILSDVGGAREVIRNDDIGLVIENPYENILDLDMNSIHNEYSLDSEFKNTDSLVSAMEKIYTSKQYWKKRAVQGKKKVEEIFNTDRVSSDYLSVYKKNISKELVISDLIIDKTELSDNTSIRFAESPLVTIMLPVYNHADYVSFAIDSVLRQSYSNWELIILDDGSTDNLLEVLKQYSDEPRIRIYTQENQKLPMALSNLHRLVRGEFLTWTSADNILEPQMLMHLVSFLISNPSCVLCYADVSLIDENGAAYTKKDYRSAEIDPSRPNVVRLPRDSSLLEAEADNFVNACFMYRKEASNILEGNYASDLTGLEDYDYWLRLAKLGDILHVKNEEPLYRYRVHKRTMSEELLTIKREEHIKRIETFWEYEKKRQTFVQGNFNINISSKTNLPFKSCMSNSEKTISFLSPSESVNPTKTNFSVICNESTFIIKNMHSDIEISRGFDIDPLCKETFLSKEKDTAKEYPSLKHRPVIGIHFNSRYLDVELLKKIVSKNKNLYFVFCDSNLNEDVEEVVLNKENFYYIGRKEFGKPYKMYSSFDAFMLPPFIKDSPENLDSMKVLSWSCNKYLYYPEELKEFEILPLMISYKSTDVFQRTDWLTDPLPLSPLLDKYIDDYSEESRYKFVLRVVKTIWANYSLPRPDFGIKICQTKPPRVLRDIFYKLEDQDFQSEIDYWDKELSLSGAYPQAIINRTSRDLMKKEYPQILEKYRKKMHGKLRVLDVGSGPLSMLAYGFYNNLFDLDCVDPLGEVYKKLLKKHNLSVDYNIFASPGESLSLNLPKRKYDMVWIHNALDHTKRPREVMAQMEKMLKTGGYLFVLGWANEGTMEGFLGLHQHDLYLRNEQLWLTDKAGASLRLDDFNSLSPVESGKEHITREWFYIIYKKIK